MNIDLLGNRGKCGIVAIQCEDERGQTGTFLYVPVDGIRYRITPLFDGLHALYPWLNQNGWREMRSEKYRTGFYFKPNDPKHCEDEPCHSPVACEGFGYCRVLNRIAT
jgi:hypothetical protein